MGQVHFIPRNGKQILVLDFGQCSADDIIQLIGQAKDIVRAQPEKSLLILTDVTGSRFNVSVSDAIRDLAQHNKPYVKASAVVGITGLMKIVYDAVIRLTGRNIPLFQTRDKAIDWLTKQ